MQGVLYLTNTMIAGSLKRKSRGRHAVAPIGHILIPKHPVVVLILYCLHAKVSISNHIVYICNYFLLPFLLSPFNNDKTFVFQEHLWS